MATKTERLHLVISPSELNEIDDWRFANRIGTRGEAVRRLAQKGLRLDAAQRRIDAGAKMTATLKVSRRKIERAFERQDPSDARAALFLDAYVSLVENLQNLATVQAKESYSASDNDKVDEALLVANSIEELLRQQGN
jgi:hypothetical protein